MSVSKIEALGEDTGQKRANAFDVARSFMNLDSPMAGGAKDSKQDMQQMVGLMKQMIPLLAASLAMSAMKSMGTMGGGMPGMGGGAPGTGGGMPGMGGGAPAMSGGMPGMGGGAPAMGGGMPGMDPSTAMGGTPPAGGMPSMDGGYGVPSAGGAGDMSGLGAGGEGGDDLMSQLMRLLQMLGIKPPPMDSLGNMTGGGGGGGGMGGVGGGGGGGGGKGGVGGVGGGGGGGGGVGGMGGAGGARSAGGAGGATDVGGPDKTGKTSTKDGYTVNDVKKDILQMQKNDPANATTGGAVKEPKLTQIAQGIVDGVNNNFSGKNGIGDYSKVSGKDMCRSLTAIAWKESRFDTNGQDAGGVMQCAQCRVDDYNKAHPGANMTQDKLKDNIPLAIKVSTWAMANPNGIVGKQAGDVPIPKDPVHQAAYYWNYNPTANHGHSNELADYMSEHEKNMGGLSGS